MYSAAAASQDNNIQTRSTFRFIFLCKTKENKAEALLALILTKLHQSGLLHGRRVRSPALQTARCSGPVLQDLDLSLLTCRVGHHLITSSP